jgi:hypothetical protein
MNPCVHDHFGKERFFIILRAFSKCSFNFVIFFVFWALRGTKYTDEVPLTNFKINLKMGAR